MFYFKVVKATASCIYLIFCKMNTVAYAGVFTMADNLNPVTVMVDSSKKEQQKDELAEF